MLRRGTKEADTFVFTSGTHDIILQFEPGIDTLDLTEMHEVFNLHWTQRPHGALVFAPELFDAHNTIFLVNVEATSLSIDDFTL